MAVIVPKTNPYPQFVGRDPTPAEVAVLAADKAAHDKVQAAFAAAKAANLIPVPAATAPTSIFYSKSTGGFYPYAAGDKNLPADAVSVPIATYKTLMTAQDAGHYIQPDANGNPTAVPPPGAVKSVQ